MRTTSSGLTAGQVFDMVKGMGRGEDDFAVIATLYQDIGGVIIGTPDAPEGG